MYSATHPPYIIIAPDIFKFYIGQYFDVFSAQVWSRRDDTGSRKMWNSERVSRS